MDLSPRLVQMLLLVCFAAWSSTRGDATQCYIGPPYTHHSIISLYASSGDHLAAVEAILERHCSVRTFSGDTARAHTKNSYIVTEEQLQALLASRAEIGEVSVDVKDVPAFIERLPKQRAGYAQMVRMEDSLEYTSSAKPRVENMFYKSYHTFEDIVARWDALVAKYPALVRSELVGKSFEGRDIVALRIGNTSADNPKRVFYNGLQHAREWIAPMVPLYIAERLVVGLASNNTRLLTALSEIEFIIIPVVNPDGYIYTRTTDRFWRKNRRNGTDCPEGGVDLNRNWPVDFNGPESTSRNPCSDVYPGTAPFSEPETRAVDEYIKAIGNLTVHIDYHSYSQLVLGSWSYTNDTPPRAAEIDKLGKMYSKAVLAKTNVEYNYGRGSAFLYLASGVMQDWSTDMGALGYTVELRPGSEIDSLQGFVLEEAQILDTCKENWAGTESVISYVLDPTVPISEDLASANPSGGGLGTVGIVLIAVGAGVAAIAGVGLIVLLVVRRKKNSASASAGMAEEGDA